MSKRSLARHGGYDDGYRAAECFWGSDPGSLVVLLGERVELKGLKVLDLGTGEGKNAKWLASRGCSVAAIDISHVAIEKAQRLFDHPAITWLVADALEYRPDHKFDVVLAYGLLHCLKSRAEAEHLIKRIQEWTLPGGWNAIVSFNSRRQELSEAHPGFAPLLLPHEWFADCYRDWLTCVATDSDLRETHPDLRIEHTHSMTRVLTRRKQ